MAQWVYNFYQLIGEQHIRWYATITPSFLYCLMNNRFEDYKLEILTNLVTFGGPQAGEGDDLLAIWRIFTFSPLLFTFSLVSLLVSYHLPISYLFDLVYCASDLTVPYYCAEPLNAPQNMRLSLLRLISCALASCASQSVMRTLLFYWTFLKFEDLRKSSIIDFIVIISLNFLEFVWIRMNSN